MINEDYLKTLLKYSTYTTFAIAHMPVIFPAVGFFFWNDDISVSFSKGIFSSHWFSAPGCLTYTFLWKNFPPKHWHPCCCQKHYVNLSCAAKGDLRKIDALGNIMLHYATLAWTEIAVSTLRRYVSYFCPTAPVICVTSALNALHGVLSEKWTVLTEGQLVGMFCSATCFSKAALKGHILHFHFPWSPFIMLAKVFCTKTVII